jgi:hypothetical protein
MYVRLCVGGIPCGTRPAMVHRERRFHTNATNVISAEHARQWLTARRSPRWHLRHFRHTTSKFAFVPHKSGGRQPPVVVHHVRAAAIVSTTWAVSPGTTSSTDPQPRRIADYGRLAWRISPRLARTRNGFRIARELTSSTDFSTAGDAMRWIADYGRLARRISPQLARPSHGLRAAGEASASPDLSTVGETVRLIAEGTLGGIMAINGSECAECVGKGAGWAVTLSTARAVLQ